MFDPSMIGFIAAACTTLAFIPQVIHTFKSKDTSAISLNMYILFVFGIALWLIYGLIINDLPIIIANLITLLLSGSILLMKVRHILQGDKK